MRTIQTYRCFAAITAAALILVACLAAGGSRPGAHGPVAAAGVHGAR